MIKIGGGTVPNASVSRDTQLPKKENVDMRSPINDRRVSRRKFLLNRETGGPVPDPFKYAFLMAHSASVRELIKASGKTFMGPRSS
jgi:hypothetical protein